MAADSAFDRVFIRQQIEDHKQDLIALKVFDGAAKDDDLKEDIKHLTHCSSDISHAREPSRRSSGCLPRRLEARRRQRLRQRSRDRRQHGSRRRRIDALRGRSDRRRRLAVPGEPVRRRPPDVRDNGWPKRGDAGAARVPHARVDHA